MRKSHDSLIDAKGRSVWPPPSLTADPDTGTGTEEGGPSKGMGRCSWLSHGVWNWDEQKKAPVIHQNDYFECDHRPGREGEALEW
ncbi:hypothetical protein PG990_014641 [Apiospora arundinis]